MRLIVLLALLGLALWWGLPRWADRQARQAADSVAAILTPVPSPTAVPNPPASAPRPTARPSGEVAVEVTEADLTRLLSDRLVGQPLPGSPIGNATVERIQVSLRSGLADASGAARLGLVSVPFSSSMTVAPDSSGRIKVGVTQAFVAGYALPEAGRDQLQVLVQREIDGMLAGQPIRVRSIEIGDGRLRAVGAPRA